MKCKMFKKFLTPLLVLIMILSMSVTAFAGTASSNGGGSGSSGGGGSSNYFYKIGPNKGGSSGFRWAYGSGAVSITNPGPFANRTANYSLNINGSHYAYVQKHTRNKGWNYCNWAWWLSIAHGGTPGSKAYMYSDHRGGIWNDGLNGQFSQPEVATEASNSGFYYNGGDMMYRNASNGQGLDAVWVSNWQTSTSDSKTTIVKITSGGETTFDRTNETAENLYNNPTTSGEYDGMSLPTEMNHSKTITALVQTVTKKDTYMTDGSNTWDHSYSYSKGGTQTITKTIKYDVKAPNIENYIFRPFDLNRNGLAEETDIKQTYSFYQDGANPLKMQVDNNQNIVDGTALQTLDTNNSTKFTITFDNDQFGIPKADEGGFDIQKDAPGQDYKLEDGTYSTDVVNQYGNVTDTSTGIIYANGMSNTNVPGLSSDYAYWGGSLTADLDLNNSSLTFNGKENAGGSNTPLTFDREFGGGDFIFKTIKVGDYHLSSSDRHWWEAQYEQGKFYTYGVKYHGTISTTDISNPSVIESGMYAKLSSKVSVQPVLKGLFKAKTVGGNIG